MYTMYLQPLGEITLDLSTIRISGFFIYVDGYDDKHNGIKFTLNKLCYLENDPYDYGYCHIISYTNGNKTTFCDIFLSLG